MIIELLDAKKRRIGTYTDVTLIDGVIRRELVDRLIKDSMDIECTLEMLKAIKEAKYIMVSGNEWFRVNPIFKTADLTYGKTMQVMCTSQTLDDADRVNLEWDGTGDFLTLVKQESVKIGFAIDLETKMSNDAINKKVQKYLDNEFSLREAIEILLQVTDSTAEFDTKIEDDYVAQTVLRIRQNLGKDYKDALIYGVNISDIKVDERIEGIVTAIEYTGHEMEDEDGNVTKLTLDRRGTDIPSSHKLPNSNRTANLTTYKEDNGNTRYLLEDTNATKTYGLYTNVEDRTANPIIEVHSNNDVTELKDLVDLAIKELDGRSVPKTQYSIQATVSGLDVGDNLGIKIPHLNIDRSLPVLTVEYDMRGEYESNIKVGDYLPTEVERRFEAVETKAEQGGSGESGGSDGGGSTEDGTRGELVGTTILSQTILYSAKEIERKGRVPWVKIFTGEVLPDDYDYYLNFDYQLSAGYSGGFFELALTYQPSPTERWKLLENTFPTNIHVQKVAEAEFEGDKGSVEIRLNDFWEFMNAEQLTGISALRYTGSGNDYLKIMPDNNVFPLTAVYDETGTAYYLHYLDIDKETPTTKEGLETLAGYLTNFTITAHERT